MGKINFNLIAHNIKTTIAEHSPEILTGIGITGMVTAMVLAVKATPNALELIADATNEKANNLIETEEFEDKDSFEKAVALTPVEKVKSAWKCYIPATATSILSIVCLISSVSVTSRRTAALAAAYTLSESTLKEYQEKVIDTFGEKKAQTLRDAVAQDKVEKNSVESKQVIITGNGETLFYDVLSDRYLTSDVETIRKSINDLNIRLRDEMYISVNDYFAEIGLPETGIGLELGWNIDRERCIDINISSAAISSDGRPCIVIDHNNPPTYKYNKY